MMISARSEIFRPTEEKTGSTLLDYVGSSFGRRTGSIRAEPRTVFSSTEVGVVFEKTTLTELIAFFVYVVSPDRDLVGEVMDEKIL